MSQRNNKPPPRREGAESAQNSASLQGDVGRWMQRAEEYAKREPSKAVVSAFSTGLLLHMLPLGRIAAATTGIAFSLMRPALLFLGLRKACDLCLRQPQQTAPAEHP